MSGGRLFISLFLCLVICGCINSEDTFYLNPDGSGKVIHRTQLLSTAIEVSIGEGSSKEETLKKKIRDELERVEGVDTWGNIFYKYDSDGGIVFEGTVYFENIEKLKFYNFGTKIGLFNKIAFQAMDSLLALEITSDDSKKEKEPALPPAQELREEQLMAEVTKQREQYQRSRVMMEGVLGSLKIKRRFYLPGEPIEVTGMEREPDGALVHEFDGKKLLEALDQTINDDALMMAEVVKGKNVVKDGVDSQPQLELLRVGKPVHARIKPANQPLFDYASETVQAREEFKKVAKGLDVMPVTAVVSGQAGEFKIAGVRIIKFSDRENNFMPFNHDKKYTISIYGPLPQEVLSVKEGKLTTAMTDTGEDVRPEQDWDRKINFSRLSKDKKAVMFEATLKDLPDSASRIAELTGELNYLIAKTTKEVDLGLNFFAAGAVGQMFEAKIKSIEPSQRMNKKEDVLALDIKKPVDEIKEVRFYDADGRPLETESRGYSASPNSVTLNFTVKGSGVFPSNGSVHAIVYDDLEKYTLPFSLKDIEIFHIKD